jgi:hypothetical protein
MTMKLARILPVVLAALALASLAPADTITSTIGGGLWTDPATWVGGIVPGIADQVVIVGPVHVGGIRSCQSLTIQVGGAVIGAGSGYPRRLEVQGAVINQGIIDDGPYTLELTVGGDLVNGGAWSADKTNLTGSGDREMSDTSGNGFVTDLRSQGGAGGDILATTPLSIAGQADITGMRLVLAPGSHLDLPETVWVGDIAAGGNEIRFASWSYLSQSTIDDAVLVGVARAAMAVHFTTRLEVRDQLENPTSTGGGAAIIEGDLVNHGLIRNVNYSFFFQVHGDVENHGTIAVPNLELVGAGATHRLHMGPDAVLDATVFLPEFQAATLIAETPVTFGDGLGLGVGTLVLEPGASLHFGTHSGLGSGRVEANGNLVTTSTGNSGLSQCTLDQAVFGDHAALHGEVRLTGGATVLGTLTSWPWAATDLTVEGRLRVEGAVTDGDQPVRIVATGDVENLGTMDNARLMLDAPVDQAVGIGPGIAVPEIVLASHVEAASYQWFRDGEALPGENGASLVLATLGPDDLGVYHCLTDGNVLRQITIAEFLDTTDVPGPASTRLAQNQPNPFNPATEIAFTLDRAGTVSLAVYDLAGREVERLVSAELGAGRHAVTWQPRGLASGVYVYRLRAPGVDLARKCSLLK